jgi:transketolase
MMTNNGAIAVTAAQDIPRLRRRIVDMAHKAREGHVPSALSILDIVYVLYTEIMGPDDKFVLSKGHGCLALYVMLAERGVIPAEWLDHFCEPGAALQGHPENSTPGVHFSSGSLGHGICGAVGLAYAKKVRGEPGHVWCLIGDGEAHEGSVWEAMRIIDDLGLSNISVIVDMNEPDRARHARRLAAFFSGSVWASDGHDHVTLRQAFGGPMRLYLLKTVKGNGVPDMEADPRAWHHRSLGLGEILAGMS